VKNSGEMNPDEQLAARLRGTVVVMGIGNPLRGDDAAGSLVARRIVASSGGCVIDAQDVPENYLPLVVNQRPNTIVLIDSVDMDSEPGSVAFLDRDQIAGYWPSTHRAPLSLLMDILEHETRARVFAIGIQPVHTEFLKPMSDAVATGVAHVAGMLNRALAESRASGHGAAAASLRGEVSA
jgi:hydrogenase maturation protease HycI